MKYFTTLTLVALFWAGSTIVFGQSDQEKAYDLAKEAIQIMDEGKLDESIKMLEECQKLDPKNYTYPYEIAYANMQKQNYKEAIKILKKTKKLKVINSQVYQTLGNAYDLTGNPKKAIKEYEAGMKVFPNAGNLYLERGNMYLMEDKYNEAVFTYEKGVEVDPMYPSNYFHLGRILCRSNDKLSGIIYGEIFMNLERSTERTLTMSKILYDTYDRSITLGKDSSKIDFCKIVINLTADDLKMENIEALEEKLALKLPLCSFFGKNFALAIIGETDINMESLSNIREKFISNYYDDEGNEDYPNVLFSYLKKIQDYGLLDIYNRYIFQQGYQDEFNEWADAHEEEFNKFVDWYSSERNYLRVDKKSRYLR